MPSVPDKRRRDDDDDALVPRREKTGKVSREKTSKTSKARDPEPEAPKKKLETKSEKAGGAGGVEPPHAKREIRVDRADPAPAPKKEKTGKVARPEPAPALPAPSGSSKKITIIAVGVVVLALGGGAAAFLFREEPQQQIAKPTPGPTLPVLNAKPDVKPTAPVEAPSTPMPKVEAPKIAKPIESPKGTPAAKVEGGKPVGDLKNKSADHAAVARLLEEYDKIRDTNFSEDDRMFEDFRRREAAEKALIDRIRQLGPGAIPAIAEMLTGLDDRAYQLLLAKALAGWDNPDAMKAVASVLDQVKDVAVQTTITRFLPDTPAAAELVANAYSKEDNPNLRAMLLREYARRTGDGEDRDPNAPPRTSAQLDAGRDVFRNAALNDPDPSVRAEAVAIIGRRGDPRDADLVAQVAKEEKNLYIRQRAIVALGETAGQSSLPALEDLARNDPALEIRASAVLAIGRVGGDRAIASLDQIARSDQSEEIRTRAERLAAALRARAQADQEERTKKVDVQPGGAPVPLEPPTPGGPSQPPPPPMQPVDPPG